MKIIFWLSLFLIFYVYAGYPIFLYLLSLIIRKPLKKADFYPFVSIIIPAYNEEGVIEEKINSLSKLNYPKEKMEILIGSDGSTDRTKEIVSHYTGENIKLFFHSARQGKPTMLNFLVSQAKGAILVFTDARQIVDKNSLSELVANFSDSTIGSVSAELLFEKEEAVANSGINLYWSYEKFIRNCESKIGSMLGATGAMYAIRKKLFTELPNDLILDDVYIPLKIIENNYRAIFEPKAKIYDSVCTDAKTEFSRKARTLAGNFQIFKYFRNLFNPFKSGVSWQLFSHKLLRLTAPFLLFSAFLSNALIINNNFYATTFMLQFIFYSLALTGAIFKRLNRLLQIPYMFCLMNAAAVVGFYRFLFNKQNVLWEKTEIS